MNERVAGNLCLARPRSVKVIKPGLTREGGMIHLKAAGCQTLVFANATSSSEERSRADESWITFTHTVHASKELYTMYMQIRRPFVPVATTATPTQQQLTQ